MSRVADRMPNATTDAPLWRNFSFLLMWSSVAASGFGDRMIQLAAEPMLGVYKQNASAAQIAAGIMFWFFLPYMGLTVLGGWMADHLPRKWIMLVCDECRALILLIAMLMTAKLGHAQAIDQAHHWKVYMIMAATGCFAAIFNPAKQSTVPQILPVAHLQQANGVLAGIALIASLIGLRIGGPIVEKVSMSLGLLIGALSYGISGFFFAFLKVKPRRSRSEATRSGVAAVGGSSTGALRYLRSHAAVRNLVVLNILFWSSAWMLNAAIAALNRTRYGIPVENYLTAKSTMLAVLGLGLLTGSLIVIWIRTRREAGIIALSALVVASGSMFALAMIRSYSAGLVLAFLIGLFGGVFLICVDTLTQSITPNHLRGRVFGTRALLNTFSAVLVNFSIWRSPGADFWMIPGLYATAGVMAVAAAWGLCLQLTRGPMQTRRLNIFWHFARTFLLVWHQLRWTGRHHVPSTGPVVIASNHTAGVDPFLIQSAVPRTIRWVMDANFRYRVMNFFWKAVDPIILQRDHAGVAAVRQIIHRARAGEVVGIFPEGGAQRDHRELMPFAAGVGMIAVRSHAQIVPVWVSDTPVSRHMLWHFLRPSRSLVVFGKPYKPDPKLSHGEIAEDLRRRLLELADG